MYHLFLIHFQSKRKCSGDKGEEPTNEIDEKLLKMLIIFYHRKKLDVKSEKCRVNSAAESHVGQAQVMVSFLLKYYFANFVLEIDFKDRADVM